jgi:uncharacterized protein YceK
MKTVNRKSIFVSIALALLLSLAGCASLTGQTTGQYVDDTTITASVKAKLVADKAAGTLMLVDRVA